MTRHLGLVIAIALLGSFSALAQTRRTATATAASANSPVPVIVTNTSAMPVKTAGSSVVTHTGQFASGHVILTAQGVGSFQLVNPDGSGTQSYAVPGGKDLVITDVDWSGQSSAADDTALVSLSVNGTGGAFMVLQSTGSSGANLIIAKSEHLSGGLVLPELPTVHVYGDVLLDRVILRGYLVPAQ